MFLKEKFETQTQYKATRKSNIPGIDTFVSTTVPKKELPFYVSYWLSLWKALMLFFYDGGALSSNIWGNV